MNDSLTLVFIVVALPFALTVCSLLGVMCGYGIGKLYDFAVKRGEHK